MKQMFPLLLRFGLGGGVATLVYAGLAFALSTWTQTTSMATHFWAICLAIPSSYCIQRFFVFRDKQAMARTLPRFMVTACFAFSLSTVAVYLCESTFGLPKVLSFLVATAAVVSANFLLLLGWVFRPQR
ncbi:MULTISPECIES: GtrA family protein [Roseobacteraceae]|uniref:GtrA family protein n=1 Tax=Roseobacteraceae TaxID=2854170 RepID=UPI003296AE96